MHEGDRRRMGRGYKENGKGIAGDGERDRGMGKGIWEDGEEIG